MILRIISGYYSYLSASIGFKFAALMDGINPNTIPMIVENATETTMAAPLIATGVSATLAIR